MSRRILIIAWFHFCWRNFYFSLQLLRITFEAMATLMEEETEDLSTCCVCLDSYDKHQHKPKFLSCGHTLCLKCIEEMDPNGTNRVTCPTCRKVCELPGSAEGLPNNIYPLHFIRMANEKKNGQFWCQTCDGIASPLCYQKKHEMNDFLAKDVEEHDTLVVQVDSGAQEALDKRIKGEKPLVVERDQLKTRLIVVEAQIEENQVAKGKLCVVIANCKEMKKLPSASKATVSMRKNLKKKLKEVKEEIQLADQFLKRSNPAAFGQPQEPVGVSNKKRKASGAESVSGNSIQLPLSRRISSFASNCSAKSKQQSQLFQSRDCVGHTDGILKMEFSGDGRFLVSGGGDKTVRLWSLSQGTEGGDSPTKVHQMRTKHDGSVLCVAISSDNSRIFSGGYDSKVLIHDAKTSNLLNSINQPGIVSSISLQPGNSNGNVIILSCREVNVLRLFDIRTSVDVPVMETTKDDVKFYWTSFSPVDPDLIASVCAAAGGSIKFFDIRQKSFKRVNTIANPYKGGLFAGAAFNRRGTRLLYGIGKQPLVVFDVPTEEQMGGAPGKVRLTSQGFSLPDIGWNTLCFAGEDDELVVAASKDHSLHVWSLPDSQGRDVTINQSLIALRGHKGPVFSIRYDHNNDVLASGGREKIIKLWNPIAQ